MCRIGGQEINSTTTLFRYTDTKYQKRKNLKELKVTASGEWNRGSRQRQAGVAMLSYKSLSTLWFNCVGITLLKTEKWILILKSQESWGDVSWKTGWRRYSLERSRYSEDHRDVPAGTAWPGSGHLLSASQRGTTSEAAHDFSTAESTKGTGACREAAAPRLAEPHRGLAGYSPWDRKELDMTEWLSTQQSMWWRWHEASIDSLDFLKKNHIL